MKSNMFAIMLGVVFGMALLVLAFCGGPQPQVEAAPAPAAAVTTLSISRGVISGRTASWIATNSAPDGR